MRPIELRDPAERFGVRLGDDVVVALLVRCRSAGDAETGGVLVGRYNAPHDCADVTLASDAPPDSGSGRAWFMRGVSGVRRLLRRAWKRKEYYLGEWHFHPGGRAEPSRQDDRRMKKIATSGRYACPEPILVIVGGHDEGWELGAFVYPAGAGRIRLGVGPVILNEPDRLGSAHPGNQNVEV